MSAHQNTEFEIKSWDEKTWEGVPWDQQPGAKLTRAYVRRAFHGHLEGEGTVEYLMSYHEEGPTYFVGLERVVGKLGGRAGSFVLQHTGTAEGEVVKSTWSVVPGSGTGDLRGLRGEGSSTLKHAERYPFPLDYHFV